MRIFFVIAVLIIIFLIAGCGTFTTVDSRGNTVTWGPCSPPDVTSCGASRYHETVAKWQSKNRKIRQEAFRNK